jgi:hypothetical protein
MYARIYIYVHAYMHTFILYTYTQDTYLHEYIHASMYKFMRKSLILSVCAHTCYINHAHSTWQTYICYLRVVYVLHICIHAYIIKRNCNLRVIHPQTVLYVLCVCVWHIHTCMHCKQNTITYAPCIPRLCYTCMHVCVCVSHTYMHHTQDDHTYLDCLMRVYMCVCVCLCHTYMPHAIKTEHDDLRVIHVSFIHAHTHTRDTCVVHSCTHAHTWCMCCSFMHTRDACVAHSCTHAYNALQVCICICT